MSIVLVLLIILLGQSPAFAAFHDSATTPIGVLSAVLFVAGLIGIQALLLSRSLRVAPSRVIFLASSSFALMILAGEYIFALLFRTHGPKGIGQLVILTVLNFVLLLLVLAWSTPWVINRQVPTAERFRIVFTPVLVTVLLASVVALFRHKVY